MESHRRPLHEGSIFLSDLEVPAMHPDVRCLQVEVVLAIKDKLALHQHEEQPRRAHVQALGPKRVHTDLLLMLHMSEVVG